LADLCGPKIRTGKFKGGQISLVARHEVVVTTRDVLGDEGLIPSQYKALAEDLKPKDRILLNDGILELRVKSIRGTEIYCTVVHGGILKDHKGINLPGVNVSAPSLTAKDRKDAHLAIELGVDFLALSFVRRPSDIQELKNLIVKTGKNVSVIAKIEKPEALEQTTGIIDATDAIMVARGDLGVELQPEQVPVVQRELIERTYSNYKPVIVATQMLESMIEHARPTRAEVTDISHAVTLGTDAVMLSAETASGAHPVKAVKMMDRIIRETESHLWSRGQYGNVVNKEKHSLPTSVWDAVSNATAHLSKSLIAQAIVVISESGMSAATMSSSRPAAPVVAITGSKAVCRKMALLWSVIPVLEEETGKIKPNLLARKVVEELKIAKNGEHVLLVRGFHSDPKSNTPSVTVLTI
ncbi:MAG: pyruvate kinase, partial [Nitrospinae bacterium]|nr:pyruvate kinase [Nitrospinota bacterium]